MIEPAPVRVLVVDDDPSIRTLVVRALERSGFAVESAKDGLEALARLEAEQFDLLVLDLMMPKLDGIGVVNRLADEPPENPPKIMIMTAASPSVLRQLPRERVAKIINKPFDLRTLVESAKTLADSGDK